MIEHYKQRIANVEAKANKAKEEKIKLEVTLNQAREKLQDVENKIKEKGLTVETLESFIQEKTSALNEAINKLEALLPNNVASEQEVIF
jgi:predicted  nucleic acid-binding Zn-ribbon protein